MSWFDEAEELRAKMKKYEEERQREAAQYWSKFTTCARQAFSLATKEAGEMKSSCIGVEHLLLGLLAAETDAGISALRNHGLTLEVTRAEVLKLNTAGGVNPPFYRHTTARLNQVQAAAKKEAMALRHTYVGTEALLLAHLAQHEGVAHRILKAANVDTVMMRTEILREIVRGEIPPLSDC